MSARQLQATSSQLVTAPSVHKTHDSIQEARLLDNIAAQPELTQNKAESRVKAVSRTSFKMQDPQRLRLDSSLKRLALGRGNLCHDIALHYIDCRHK